MLNVNALEFVPKGNTASTLTGNYVKPITINDFFWLFHESEESFGDQIKYDNGFLRKEAYLSVKAARCLENDVIDEESYHVTNKFHKIFNDLYAKSVTKATTSKYERSNCGFIISRNKWLTETLSLQELNGETHLSGSFEFHGITLNFDSTSDSLSREQEEGLLVLEWSRFYEFVCHIECVEGIGYRTWNTMYLCNDKEEWHISRHHTFFVAESNQNNLDKPHLAESYEILDKAITKFLSSSYLFNRDNVLYVNSILQLMFTRTANVTINIIRSQQQQQVSNIRELNNSKELQYLYIHNSTVDVLTTELAHAVECIKWYLQSCSHWMEEHNFVVCLRETNRESDNSSDDVFASLSLEYIVNIFVHTFGNSCNIICDKTSCAVIDNEARNINDFANPLNMHSHEHCATRNSDFTKKHRIYNVIKLSESVLTSKRRVIMTIDRSCGRMMSNSSFSFMLHVMELYRRQISYIDHFRGVFGKDDISSTKMLTLSNINAIASMFQDNTFSVCRRPLGTEILLGVDRNGACFILDKTSCLFCGINQLPVKLPLIMHDSLFSAVICTTPFSTSDAINNQEQRIVITDVYMLQTQNIFTLPFEERWRYLNMCRIDDEYVWPHCALYNRIVIVKASYAILTEEWELSKLPETDHATLGLLIRSNKFVGYNEEVAVATITSKTKHTYNNLIESNKTSLINATITIDNNKQESNVRESVSHNSSEEVCLTWIPPESVTVYFRAGKVECVDSCKCNEYDITNDNFNNANNNNNNNNTNVRRALLQVYRQCNEDNNELTNSAGALNDKESKHDDYFKYYYGEYANYDALAYPHLTEGSIIECMLHRNEDKSHWWDVLNSIDLLEDSNYQYPPVATLEQVNQLLLSPPVDYHLLEMLADSKSYTCKRCGQIDLTGSYNNNKHDTREYWCTNCWREMGYDNCNYCGDKYMLGAWTADNELFYCEKCWYSFETVNKNASVGYYIPPPTNSTYAVQVKTRCMCLLIDFISTKYATNDVLELCCDAAVPRKWIHNLTQNYIGVSMQNKKNGCGVSNVMNDFLALQSPSSFNYNHIYTNCFKQNFWSEVVAKVHPRQFHVITCFTGFHQELLEEERIRHFIGSIANALIPGGVFVGMFVDAEMLFSKGSNYTTEVCTSEWSTNARPQFGNTFLFSDNEHAKEIKPVIPLDFLVAVAAEYDLHIISSVNVTLAELIERDNS